MTRLWRFLEHVTNPLHVFCRLMIFLDIYDALWCRVFKGQKKCNWFVGYSIWGRIKDNRLISTRLMNSLYDDIKHE